MTAESNKSPSRVIREVEQKTEQKLNLGYLVEVLPSIYRQRTPKTDIETNPIQRPRIERR